MKKRYQKESLCLISCAIAALCFTVPMVFLIGVSTSDGHTPSLRSTIVARKPLQEHYNSQVKLSKGKFLVASRRMADPRFRETVILLVDYTKNGAMGLVINRPSEVKLHALFPDLKGIKEKTDTVFMGGPVARNQMIMLLSTARLPDEDSVQVFQDIYVSSSMDLLKRLVSEGRETFRMYNGYSGWAAGQLEWELSRGDWHVVQADAEAIFDKDPLDVWPELILRSSAIQVRQMKQQGPLS